MIGFFVVLTIIVAFTAVFVIWPFYDKYKEHSRKENDNVPVVKISYKTFLDMYETNPRRWRIRPCGTMENDFYALVKDDIWDDKQVQLFYRDDTQIQEWMSEYYTGFTQIIFSIWDFARYRYWFKQCNKTITMNRIIKNSIANQEAKKRLLDLYEKDKNIILNQEDVVNIYKEERKKVLNLFDALEDNRNA